MSSCEPLGAIFDLDGVIVDTKEGHCLSFKRLGEEVGYTITEEQFKHIFGRHNNDIFPILYGHPLPPERIAELADRKEAIFRDTVRGRLRALPGVCDLLPALKAAGFRVGIGTSTPLDNVTLVLGELGLAGYIDAISSAEDVTEGKPNPQVFLIAATRIGVAAERCVVVEDAVAGVQAAHNGGMAALAVTTNHTRADLAQADRIVDSLAEVGPADFAALAMHNSGRDL